MGFSFERELQHAVRTINNLILNVNRNGGGICLHYLDNPDFSIKLDRPVDIAYFAPLSRTKEWTL
ncbi:MAG: hypothetical protein K2N78_02765 [Oscillospiraceae bacterium]|nr:hypothetical protein [Oscillospiraceae bacterium]